MDSAFDVLVIGGGPSGASAAYWLAEAGHKVLVVERKKFPREKTCGDGLTPRAVRQLEDMGLGGRLAAECLRYDGLRSIAHGVTLELAWPEHPDFPAYGYVVRRRDLDEMVADMAVKAGATLRTGVEALEPIIEEGLVCGAQVRDTETDEISQVRARYVVVADGSNSRFGRALGTNRDRTYPLGMAVRGYFRSPRHAEPWIESHLDIRDRHGDQHAAKAQPQAWRSHTADAAQVGLEAGVEDQQRQAHPMQGLHLQRAEGLGLVHPLDGNHQA